MVNCGQDAISFLRVITEKVHNNGAIWIKATVVVSRFEETNIKERTDCPACVRDSLRVLFAVFRQAAGVVTAWMSKQSFCRAKIQKENCMLWRLYKTFYVFPDEVRAWLGMAMSCLDMAVFLYY